MNFYSNGKLLLTGEYVVLDGAKALAIPTCYGQTLSVVNIEEPIIQWKSLNEKGQVWFECVLDSQNLQLINSSFYSSDENAKENIAETLQSILLAAQNLNSEFLSKKSGISVVTKLTFPASWGLGSSSTLINNVANWANVNPFELLKKTFGGSGYDIACAQNKTPIIYQLVNDKSVIKEVRFNPKFSNQLFFIHLNKKQDSRKGIKQYRKNQSNLTTEIDEISSITKDLLNAKSIQEFEKLMVQHEKIIGKIINQKPIQQVYFSDYFGKIKSLGAWGGDFILATGNENTPHYFIEKGFNTVIPYHQMIL